MTGKLYRIGEAAALLDLKSYVLRFWETEFPQLEPVRTDKGQRLYTEGHIELLKLIKKLLHERGLTIDGARRILNNSPESQKLLHEEDSSQLMASEFSSEMMLAGTYLPDDDYGDDEASDEDEEQAKVLLPQWLALLDETIDELEKIRAMLAPLEDIVNNPPTP